MTIPSQFSNLANQNWPQKQYCYLKILYNWYWPVSHKTFYYKLHFPLNTFNHTVSKIWRKSTTDGDLIFSEVAPETTETFPFFYVREEILKGYGEIFARGPRTVRHSFACHSRRVCIHKNNCTVKNYEHKVTNENNTLRTRIHWKPEINIRRSFTAGLWQRVISHSGPTKRRHLVGIEWRVKNRGDNSSFHKKTWICAKQWRICKELIS